MKYEIYLKKMVTFGKICHTVKYETHLKMVTTVKNLVSFEKVSHIWKKWSTLWKGWSHCKKWITFEKISHTVKKVGHIWKNWLPWKTCPTVEIGHILKNGSHYENVSCSIGGWGGNFKLDIVLLGLLLILRLDVQVFVRFGSSYYLTLSFFTIKPWRFNVKHCPSHNITYNLLLFNIHPQYSVIRTWRPQQTNFTIQLCSFIAYLLLVNILIFNMLYFFAIQLPTFKTYIDDFDGGEYKTRGEYGWQVESCYWKGRKWSHKPRITDSIIFITK